MRTLLITCLSALFLISGLLEPAEAGRRARRARRTAVVAGVAGGTTAAAVVASRRAHPTVVAAAPARQATPAVVVQPLPDLTIAEISAEDTVQCVVVQNIGAAAAGKSYMQVDVSQATDQTLVSSSPVQIPVLQPGQSVRVRLHAIPSGHVFLAAYADADNKIAEANEENNASQLEIVPATLAPPAELPAVDVWVGPEQVSQATSNDTGNS